MPHYVKNESKYKKIDFESSQIRAAAKRAAEARKRPTSVALDPQLIDDLKVEARNRGVPYQVLMRMFIIEGFRRLKRAG